MSSRQPAFLGKGVAFPFRINPNTGGVLMTEGNLDNLSVALQYVYETWTRDDSNQNHIAEAISHILLTNVGEHDNLPEFGSRLEVKLFEPNTEEFKLLAELYMKTATQRWEKRVTTDSFEWLTSNLDVDQGASRSIQYMSFIAQQAAGNLVAPFVTVRQARTQEYPAADIDENGHDYQSQYYGAESFELNGIKQLRLMPLSEIPPAIGDEFYKVLPTDTWMLIAHKKYAGDVRLWKIIARAYVDDAADKEDASLEDLDPYNFPAAGEVIRIPSAASVYMKKVA